MSDRLDDKTRILTLIIDRLKTASVLARKDHEGRMVMYDGEQAPQFADEYLGKAKPGDVVLCNTGYHGPWKISYLVEHKDNRSDGRHLLREIGSDRLCEMGNESLSVLVGVNPNSLLDGLDHKIYRWCTSSAFKEKYNENADYYIRCGGGELIEQGTIRVWARPHIFHQIANKEGLVNQPKSVDIHYNKKTTLKSIVKTMNDAGLFNGKWKKSKDEPTKGMSGCLKITK